MSSSMSVAERKRANKAAAKFKVEQQKTAPAPAGTAAAPRTIKTVAANDYGEVDTKAIERREVRAGNEVVREADDRLNILTRDGLAWLVKKKKLSMGQQLAAEHYRKDWQAVHVVGLRSCINDRPGGAGAGPADQANVTAILMLEDARDQALNGDGPLIWLVDEVAGKGSTLRDLAKLDERVADRLLAKFETACDLLAGYYGYASKKTA